jgi:hypothetical protein
MAWRSDWRCSRKGSAHLCLNAGVLTESVESGAAAMLKICGMVLAFAALLSIAEAVGLFQLLTLLMPTGMENATALVQSILEISCITEYMQQGGSFPMAAALLSFGGICVHLQAASICDGNFAWGKFWMCRILTAFMSYGFCSVGFRILCRGETVAVMLGQTVSSTSGSTPVPGLCLLLMSVLLLQRQEKLRRKMTDTRV